jgi:hypothetical protein
MKLSLRSLLLFVALVAVVTAALAQPSLFWMRIMFTVTVAFLAFAAVGSLAARGKTRTFWIGAVVFAGAYAYVLASEQTTGFQARSTMMQRALITQPLLDALAQARGLEVRSHFADFNLWDPAIYTDNTLGSGGMGGPGMPGMGSGIGPAPPGGGGFFDVDPEGAQDTASGGTTPPGSSGFGENSDGGAFGSAGSMGPPSGMSSSVGGPMSGYGGSGTSPPAGAPPLPVGAFTYGSYNHFLITGHCAVVILVGLIGGLLSRWAFGREE